MKRIYRTFILLPLAGCFLWTGCSGEDEQALPAADGKKIQVNFSLSAPRMTETGEVSASTRALTALTLEEESAVKSLSYFEFSGTADDSRCIGKGTASMGSGNYIASLSLSASTDVHAVYVVANLGDVTTGITADESTGTTLAAFKALTFSYTTDIGKESTGLPMIGSTNMIPSSGSGSILLTRMVARIKFGCNLQIPSGDGFAVMSLQLKNVPLTGSYTATTGFPAADAGNFTAYAANAGSAAVWYIPANTRGTNTGITVATDKTAANAPDNFCTYVEMRGVYRYSFGQTKEVVYRFYLGENDTSDFNITRNKAYNVTVTIKGVEGTDARITGTVSDLCINALGSKQTANSYIVREGAKNYKFDGRVMGNGATTAASTIISASNGTQNAPEIVPTTLTPANALVLWETGSAGSVIEAGSVVLGTDGYVRFKTASNSTNGNAVIAVRDASNNILWSWHIWKVPYNPNTEYETYTNFAGRSFKMMKYNLGATEISNWSGTATNAGDLGLFYQWGRKDPFVGASGWTTTSQTPAYTSPYTRANVLNTDAGSGADATIQYSVLNPTNFIRGTSSVTYDWLNVTTYADQRDNLWGNPNASATVPNAAMGSKSIYDPCPPGWRVPPQDAFTRFTTTGSNTSTLAQFNAVTSTLATNKGYDFYYTATGSGSSTYYPASGYLLWNSGALTNVSSYGFYWSSSSNVGGGVGSGRLNFGSSYVYPLNYNYRSYGFVVRCAQE